MYRRAMLTSLAPRVLWDHCLELQAEIRLHTALELMQLSGDVPLTLLMSDTPDISNLCQFAWYEPVWFIDPTDPLENKKLSRYLGPSHNVGDAMCSKVLNSKGNVLVRSSVFPMLPDDTNSELVKQQISEFDETLQRSLGDRGAGIEIEDDDEEFETPDYTAYADDVNGEEPTMMSSIMMHLINTYQRDSFFPMPKV
jgi:hypothetical protein